MPQKYSASPTYSVQAVSRCRFPNYFRHGVTLVPNASVANVPEPKFPKPHSTFQLARNYFGTRPFTALARAP